MQHGPDNGRGGGAAPVTRLRANRQARVGILPNPNRPVVPPPRRPPLVGKWMRLRSSRRPPPPADPLAAGPADPGQPGADAALAPDVDTGTAAASLGVAGIVDRDGDAIRRIDLDRLARSVEGLGQNHRQRSGIADQMQPEADAPGPATAPPAAPAVAPAAPAAPVAPPTGFAQASADPKRDPMRAALVAPDPDLPPPTFTGGLRTALARLLSRG